MVLQGHKLTDLTLGVVAPPMQRSLLCELWHCPASSNHSFFSPCLNFQTALLAKISITLHVTVHLLQIKLLCCNAIYCAGVMPFGYELNFLCSCCAIFYHCFCFYVLSS